MDLQYVTWNEGESLWITSTQRSASTFNPQALEVIDHLAAVTY